MRKRHFAVLLAVLFLAGAALYQNLWKTEAKGSSETQSGGSASSTAADQGSYDASPTAASGTASGAPGPHQQAPVFTLKDLAGRNVRVAAAGKPYVINFWASWCEPCQQEADDLEALYTKYQGKLNFYAVDATQLDSLDGAKQFVSKHGYTMPVLLDSQGKVMDLYYADAFPTTYFVDGSGVVRNVLYGLSTKQVWDEQLSGLVNGS